MKKLCFCLLVIVLFSILIIGCGGGTPITDEAAINGLLDDYSTGMKNENADQVVACFTDPFTYNIFNRSIADYKAELENVFAKNTITNYQVIDRLINIIDSSNATGTATEILSKKEFSDLIISVKYTFVKQSGSWKISGIAPAAP